MSDAHRSHTVDTESKPPAHTVDTDRGHTVDTMVTDHRGHGRVGLDNPPGPVAGSESLFSLLGYHRPAWFADALCKEYRHLDFTVERGRVKDEAMQVCGRCAVMLECRSYAVADETLVGIFGGTDSAARRAMRRARPGVNPPPVGSSAEDPPPRLSSRGTSDGPPTLDRGENSHRAVGDDQRLAYPSPPGGSTPEDGAGGSQDVRVWDVRTPTNPPESHAPREAIVGSAGTGYPGVPPHAGPQDGPVFIPPTETGSRTEVEQ